MACPCCQRHSAPNAENVLGAQLSEVSYLLLYNCDCSSTRAVVLWASEELEREATEAA